MSGTERQRHGAWLLWAAAQIEATLWLDGAANDELLAAVRTLRGAGDVPAADAAHGLRDAQFDRIGIAVQTHDRWAQQLIHVAGALRALAQLLEAARPPSDEDWRSLRRRQLASFSMSEERILFRRMVPAPDDGDGGADLDAAGSPGIELFE